MPSSPDPIETIDVAIVGGGVGGCYTGWRLLTGDCRERPSVGLYEGSPRIGGRLWSVRLRGLPDVWGEFGGMRFNEKIFIIADLVRHLGLGALVRDFHSDMPGNITFTRGERFRMRDLTGAAMAALGARLPYRLEGAERGLDVAALNTLVADFAIEGFTPLREAYQQAFAAAEWDRAALLSDEYQRRKHMARVNGERLHDMAWWTLLSMIISQEAIDLIEDTGGYNSLASNGNAASWLDNTFYAADVPDKCLATGFQTLPETLHEQFVAAGGRSRMGHRLIRFDRAGDHYDLLFRDQRGRAVTVRAGTLVLALPKRALHCLEQDNAFFRDPAVQRGIGSTQSVHANKIFMAYGYPWWQALGVSTGRSTTDLPIRQCYYAGTSGHESDSRGLLMGAYTNGGAVDYWSSLQDGPPYAPNAGSRRERFFFAGSEDEPPAAPRLMVTRAHAMIMAVHGVKQAPLPYDAHYQNWSQDPYGGGWHVWKPGVDMDAIIPFMRDPMSGERIHVVCECWSNEPGSVQGSLNTAECLVQDQFGLTWPSWLQRGGTRLGPR